MTDARFTTEGGAALVLTGSGERPASVVIVASPTLAENPLG